MEVQFWILLTCIAGFVVVTVWWKRRARRALTIDHVRVELHDARIVDDRVIEAVWRVAISMTNNSRRPRALPVFGERATVTGGRRVYLAGVYLESDAVELNPQDVTLAWIEFVLPAGVHPRRGRILQLRELRPGRSVQFIRLAMATNPTGVRTRSMKH